MGSKRYKSQNLGTDESNLPIRILETSFVENLVEGSNRRYTEHRSRVEGWIMELSLYQNFILHIYEY